MSSVHKAGKGWGRKGGWGKEKENVLCCVVFLSFCLSNLIKFYIFVYFWFWVPD